MYWNGKHSRCNLVIFLLVAGSFERVTCQEENSAEDADDGPEETPPEKTCFQTLIGLQLDLLPVLPKCLFGGNVINMRLTNIFQALPRIYCVLKCVFAELTVFTPEGTLDEVSALLFFQESFPEYALPPLVEKAQLCLGMSSNFKPNQYYCQSYAPFVQCLAQVLVTGIGPFALECVGIPFFNGLFGLLNFIVPTERNPPAGDETRRLIASLATNGTTKFSGSLVAIVKERREQLRIQHEKIEALRRLNAPPTFAPQLQGPTSEKLSPDAPTTMATTPIPVSATLPTLFSQRSWRSPYQNSNSINYNRGGFQTQPFSLDFFHSINADANNLYNSLFNTQFHSNNTETVVYQMDRITNLAKSLQLLLTPPALNSTSGRFYRA